MSSSKIECLHNAPDPTKRILFLGYNQSQTRIIDSLVSYNCYIDHTQGPFDGSEKYDLAICFGYRHILPKNVIDALGCPILNLHISYLPYNRGAHPNFWSFFENTPSGVTIHLVDEGVDTGPIVYQKYVKFNKNEITFSQTHKRLINEVENLFEKKLPDILEDKWQSKPQLGLGSVHYLNDLPKNFSGWDSVIPEELKKLQKFRSSQNEK